MATNFWLCCVVAFCSVYLTACQSVPAPLQGGLTPAQVAVVQQEGFSLGSEGWLLGFPDRILFQTDHYEITAEKQQPLLSLAQHLRTVDIERLRIQGHTDSTGQPDYNDTLSKNRAQAVANVLQKAGFTARGLSVEGYGATRPVASNTSEEGRASNRRVAVVILP